jgi:hypothetical protein
MLYVLHAKISVSSKVPNLMCVSAASSTPNELVCDLSRGNVTAFLIIVHNLRIKDGSIDALNAATGTKNSWIPYLAVSRSIIEAFDFVIGDTANQRPFLRPIANPLLCAFKRAFWK